jgi:cytoskeletal protein CcmA (bactofilin family)
MWNKRDDAPAPGSHPAANPGATPPAPMPRPAPMQPPAPRPPAAAIGASMRIKGEISAREELLVDGEVEGTLESQSAITIGVNGKVRANIKAREVVVLGSVRGNIEASEKIAIREKGSLVGDIKTAGISIDDGAYFKGSIDIVRPEQRNAAKPAAVAAPVSTPITNVA